MQKSFSKLQARTQLLLREYSEKEVFLQQSVSGLIHTMMEVHPSLRFCFPKYINTALYTRMLPAS